MSDLRQRCEALLRWMKFDSPDSAKLDKLETFARSLVGTWTTEKPTTPGWYWRKTEAGRDMHIVRAYEYRYGIMCEFALASRKANVDVKRLRGQWAGPIAEPEEQP